MTEICKDHQAVLSEAVKTVLGPEGKLSYAYTEDGLDYFVSSDVFRDSKQGIHGILLVVQQAEKELVLHLPYLLTGSNTGFAERTVRRIKSFIKDDQLGRAFCFSPGFRKKYLGIFFSLPKEQER